MCIIVNFFPLWTIQIEAIYIFLYALIIFNYNMAISLSIHQYLNIVMDIVYNGLDVYKYLTQLLSQL